MNKYLIKMKKLFYILYVAVVIAVVSTGCTKSFSDLNKNENKPTDVPASLLFNGILNDMYDAPYTYDEKWCQYFCQNYDYYGNNRYDFGPGADKYSTLKNNDKMVAEAETQGLPALNPYDAMSKFFKAYFFTKMSLQMGDIPMNEALQGISNLTPSYDPQKTVFLKAFVWLDSANTELASLIASG